MVDPTPEDVLEMANQVLADIHVMSIWDMQAEVLARVIMAERLSSAALQREKDAKIAENSNYFPSEGDSIARAIREG